MARLLTPAAALALALLSIFNIGLAAAATSWQIGTDFRLPYAAAEIGLRYGWSHMYDPELQRTAVLALGHSDVFFPYINAPPWAFLVTPMTFIPYTVAYWICVAVMVACLVTAALLAAPPDRLLRIIYLGAAFGSLEVALGPGFGQPAALVALAIVACWRLLKADRPALAGLVLAVISVKPHIALLVPFALLLAGLRARVHLLGGRQPGPGDRLAGGSAAERRSGDTWPSSRSALATWWASRLDAGGAAGRPASACRSRGACLVAATSRRPGCVPGTMGPRSRSRWGSWQR